MKKILNLLGSFIIVSPLFTSVSCKELSNIIYFKKIIPKIEQSIQKINSFDEAKNKISYLEFDELKSITFKSINILKNYSIEFLIDLETKDKYVFENNQTKITLNIKTDVKLNLLNKWYKIRLNRIPYYWKVVDDNNIIPGAKLSWKFDSNDPDANKNFKIELFKINTIKITGFKDGDEKILIVKYGNSDSIKVSFLVTYKIDMKIFELRNENDYEKVYQFIHVDDEINLDLKTDMDANDNLENFNNDIKNNFKVSIRNDNCKKTLNIKYIQKIDIAKLKENVISLFPPNASTGMNIKFKVK